MKRNSPCANYNKSSGDWRRTESKPCEYCREIMIPSASAKRYQWETKKYCSSFCSASARSPYAASKVLRALTLAAAAGVMLLGAKPARAGLTDFSGSGSPGGFSVWHDDHWDWMGIHQDPTQSVPEPSNPGVLLAVAGAALLARRARKP